MRHLLVVVLSVLILFASSCLTWGGDETEPYHLRVIYLEFPPYYYTNADGEPDGFLFKKSNEIFRLANIVPHYESLPVSRILLELRGVKPVGSIGWFKTPQREKFAKFSQPIYRNLPLHVLYLKENAPLLDRMESLQDIMKDKTLVMGEVDGYSYGPVVDHLLQKGEPTTCSIVGEQPQLVRMLATERFSYMLAAPEEISTLVEMNHLSPDLFQDKQLDDIPAGNLRHFMFSRKTPDSVVIRINRAIELVEKKK